MSLNKEMKSITMNKNKSQSPFICALRSPYLGLFTGIFLCITSGIEVIHELDELLAGEASLGMHHGILLFGCVHTLKALAEILRSASDVAESLDSK